MLRHSSLTGESLSRAASAFQIKTLVWRAITQMGVWTKASARQ